jgi:Tol biopolymer transport system component/predicted Ser/Thr protein kinase
VSEASLSQIGTYQVIREIGRGGMGVVYLGRDERLDRHVAIKALPEALAADPDRLARFEREARTLAQLNHPNVAGIYGVEEQAGRRYLVLEYVEGQTLAERLDGGALPENEALEIGVQIASGLEASHEAGVIHRDLKPANIKITPDGRVKVLDFGLAKSDDGWSAASGSGMSQSPTLTTPQVQHSPTIPGVILGTAAYMSPEQARGGDVDKRTDIWAFGVVLYEMLSGMSMFAGETVSDTLAGVLKSEIEFSELPASTPAPIRRLLRRCLERNPKNRLHDIADARIVLDEVIAGESDDETAAAVAGGGLRRLPWTIAAAGVGVAIVAALIGRPGGGAAPNGALTRTSILTPFSAKADLDTGRFALSPDGGAVVFLATDATGSRLYVRELDETEARPLPRTDGAVFPFWSADSQHIAFFADDMLRRVPRGGGPVQIICAAEDGRGGAWNRDGTILFAADFRNAPLLQVSASGGEPIPATALDTEKGEISHRFPDFLPDGRHFTFSVEPRDEAKRSQVKVASLDEVSKGKPLLKASTAARFAAPDHLVFTRDGALMAHQIDLARLEMVGEAQLLEDRPSLLQVVTNTPAAHVADSGAMLYAPVDPRPTDFRWLDRNGVRSESLIRTEGLFTFPAISHSGDRVAVAKGRSFDESAIWIFDLEHGAGSQITSPNQSAYAATWMPDDRDLVSHLSYGGAFAPVFLAPESGRTREILEPTLRWTNPTDVSADGLVMLYDDQTPEMKQNLGYLRLDGEPERTDYLTTPAAEMGGRLSPDGKHIAYLSDSTGADEVYVDTFPVPTRARRITTSGAALQVDFRDDGTELFILAADGDRASLYACALSSADGLTIGRPEKLFTLPVEWSGFAPSPDGERFLLLEHVGSRSPSLTLVENWQAQLTPQR